MYLSVIIPAYNEEKRIRKTLIDIDLYFKNKNIEHEILVVNDGSYDKTRDIVTNHMIRIPNLRLLDLRENRGKGFAVREGMKNTRGQYKLFMDADNSTSIENLDTFMPYFKEGFDIIVSSRQMPESTFLVKQPLYRRILGWVFRKIVHVIVPVPVRDSQNGFKIFTKESANFLFSKQTVFGWAFDVEILALAKKYKFKVKEIGIQWRNDSQSKLTLNGMVKMLYEVIKIRKDLFSKKYDIKTVF